MIYLLFFGELYDLFAVRRVDAHLFFANIAIWLTDINKFKWKNKEKKISR